MHKKMIFRLLCVLLLLNTTACGNKKTELSENNAEGMAELTTEITDQEFAVATNDVGENVTATEVVEKTPLEETEDTQEETEETQEETESLNAEEYGTIDKVEKKFYSHTDKEQEVYYYTIEQFLFQKEYEYAEVVNETLTQIYEDYAEKEEEAGEEKRNNTAEEYEAGMGVEYGSLLFSKLTYADEKYVSLCFNNVAYMGGAHPYTYQVSYTIDVATGKIVDAEDVLGKSKEEILTENPKLQSWPDASEEIYGYGSYYLTKDRLVFYRGLLNTDFEEVYVEYTRR